MPSIVPSRTNQSSAFMQSNARRWRAIPRPAQKTRRQKCKCRASGGSPARAGPHRKLVDRLAVTSFAKGNQVGEKPVSPGDSGRKLAKKRKARVDVISLAVLRDEQAAVGLLLAGVAHRERRGVILLVPLAREIRAALLHPAGEISGGDFVRHVERGVVGQQESDGGVLVGHTQRRGLTLNGERVRAELLGAESVGAVVLCDDGAALLDPCEQRGEIRREVSALVERALSLIHIS